MRKGRRVIRIGYRLASACVLLAGMAALPAGGEAPAPATPPPASNAPTSGIAPEVRAALEGLRTSDEAGRQRIYAVTGDKGDARLIPMLKAYRDGSLIWREGTLAYYGERTSIPGRGQLLPLLDAFTAAAVKGADGQPLYFAKPELSKAVKAPPRSERGAINDLISALSILDPDPAARIRSIQDIGERASRAFIDPDEAASFTAKSSRASVALKTWLVANPSAPASDVAREAVAALDLIPADRGADTLSPSPTLAATEKVAGLLAKVEDALKPPSTSPASPASAPATSADGPSAAVAEAHAAARTYADGIELKQKTRDELPKYLGALQRQLDKEPNSQFSPALREAKASIEAVIGDRPTQSAAVGQLGKIGTARAANLLRKLNDAAHRFGDADLEKTVSPALRSADRYQAIVHWVQVTFAGLSAGSILVLLALGLSIIFGLMGVINMAHGEFMMVGAFTTYCVSELFKHLPPAWFNWYPVAAIPAAFLVAGLVGLACEWVVIRHLYGRPLETLLATLGISFVLIWLVRRLFGDTVSVTPPTWMTGDWEVAPDLRLALNRVFIIVYCAICIVGVYLLVNRTKLGLLLRATTQGREMSAALGVPVRWVDALTFALGAGLAGLAGVVVPLYNKINPNVGQEYIVDSFMVVVAGGVGKLAGAIWAGLGMGFINKYLESALGYVPWAASGASVYGRVAVLAGIVVLLVFRPQGLFPPKGRLADSSADPPPLGDPPPPVILLRRGMLIGTLALFFVGVPLLNAVGLMPDYRVNFLGKYLCFAFVALGIDLIWGYTGMLSLCQALFFCVGGYIMGMHLSLPQGGGDVRPEYNNVPQFLFFNNVRELPIFWKPFGSLPLTFALGLCVPVLAASVFGFFIFRSRMRGVYFSIVTQAVALVAWMLISRNELLMGGTNGLTNFSKVLTEQRRYVVGLYLLTAVLLVPTYLLCRAITRSRLGRILVAVRDRESRLYFAGYRPYAFKVFAFAAAAVLAAIGGMLYTPQVTIISPQSMDVFASIFAVSFVAIGGRGRLWGAVVGALAINAIQTAVTSDLPSAWLLVFGLLFMVVVVFPDGLVGVWDKFERLVGTGAPAGRIIMAGLPLVALALFVLGEVLGLTPAIMSKAEFAGVPAKYLCLAVALLIPVVDHWLGKSGMTGANGAIARGFPIIAPEPEEVQA